MVGYTITRPVVGFSFLTYARALTTSSDVPAFRHIAAYGFLMSTSLGRSPRSCRQGLGWTVATFSRISGVQVVDDPAEESASLGKGTRGRGRAVLFPGTLRIGPGGLIASNCDG